MEVGELMVLPIQERLEFPSSEHMVEVQARHSRKKHFAFRLGLGFQSRQCCSGLGLRCIEGLKAPVPAPPLRRRDIWPRLWPWRLDVSEMSLDDVMKWRFFKSSPNKKDVLAKFSHFSESQRTDIPK